MRSEATIKLGDFVIIQRQEYMKLLKIKENCTVTLGKDVIEVSEVIGQRFYETFRMVLKPGGKRCYALEIATKLTTQNNLQIEESGVDNRNLVDDGTSQVLTKNEIEDLRDQATSSSDIVEKLISNSKTFTSKTEYSQEKYLKKKVKKYFEQDPNKTLGIRIDDLSQILTYSNIQSDGEFLLYDSGTSGLLPATIINAIGANTPGKLIHVHPGNECQKNALLAMDFPKEQLQRCINVNLYSVLRHYYQSDGGGNEEELITEDDTKKRKLNEEASTSQKKKKTCWQIENERACKILESKVDGIIVAAKEHPLNVVKELSRFLKAGRTLVVFCAISEPLEELYFYLKNVNDFIGINLSRNFMRHYQVLENRTHPEVSMNFGGYILTGYKLNVK
ncbi:hypothetical protein FQR65_LT16234 [Abscondita terminalis]|nr:hypothetical protein FQR65_LT16234 [Abscondita terminalis]